jgi:hypothetical protein
MLPKIQQLYGKAAYWHGTGRYQHTPTGPDKDILDGIATKGALSPQLDTFDFVSGDAQSISLAPTRMYARDYARMFFPKGKDIPNLYGEGVWSRRMALAAGLALLTHPSIILKMGRDKKNITHNARNWVARITREHIPTKTILSKSLSARTDIPNNYPLLFGIKDENLVFRKTDAKYLAYEKRVTQPITLQTMSHVEVPFEKVQETKQVLEEKGIILPVIPIEFGEQYCRNFSFTTLMRGGPLPPQENQNK